MSIPPFDRDAMAAWYATEHFKTDPGVRSIDYLKQEAPDREIRFLEVNELLAERDEQTLEPFDFGVDIGSVDEHTLYVLDVTLTQWKRIRQGDPNLSLPRGWSLEQAKAFDRSLSFEMIHQEYLSLFSAQK